MAYCCLTTSLTLAAQAYLLITDPLPYLLTSLLAWRERILERKKGSPTNLVQGRERLTKRPKTGFLTVLAPRTSYKEWEDRERETRKKEIQES